MLLIEVQQYNPNCEHKKTGCHCLSIVSSGAEQRLSVASTTISRQYVQCKRRRKRNSNEEFKQKKNCKLTTDKMSFHLDDDCKKKKLRPVNQAKMKQGRKLFTNSFNQSFSIFFNYLQNYETPSTSSNLLHNKFSGKFRFTSRMIKTVCFIILACVNCASASENMILKSLALANSTDSTDASSQVRTFKSISYSTKLSISNPKNTNSSIFYSSSLDFVKNLLPSTRSFNYFYERLHNHSTSESTTRLSNVARFLNSSSTIPNLIHLNGTNQTYSAHANNQRFSDAFQLKFNQVNLNLSTNSSNSNLGILPLGFEILTQPAKQFSNYNSDSRYSTALSSHYDSKFSSSNLIPTPNALVSNQSNKTLQDTLNDTNEKPINLNANNSERFRNEDFIDNLNITDSDTSFMEDFLQPFTNISWWFKVPFPKSGYHNYSIVFLAFFITIVMMLVVIGNLLVCIAICTEKSLKTIQNWFIASLAISDLLLGLIIMPFSLAYELIGTWIFSDLWCDFHHALDVLLTTASINNLCLISLDRYWSVTQAIEYLKKRTPCRAIFMIVFAWVFSAVVCLPPLIGWKKDNQEPGECQLSNDLGYVVYSSLGSFYIPSIVMIFVYAKIFVAARSRARKHVRKKQKVSGGSIVQEQKKSPSLMIKPSSISQQPLTSNSSQDNATYNKLVNTSASPTSNQQIQQQVEDSQEDLGTDDLKKSEVKGSLKMGRVPVGRFARRALLGINDQGPEENSLTDVHQQSKGDSQQDAINLYTISDQKTNKEWSSGIGTEEHQITNSAPTSGSSAQSETADDKKTSNFVCAQSTSAFTYDNLFVDDRKAASGPNEKSESIGRPVTPSSKVTFSPNDIVFDLKTNGIQSVSMVPQIVIHGSMQQLHLQANAKRARFPVNKMKDSDFNNNRSSHTGEKRFGHQTITGTLSAGQLDCVILDQSGLKEIRGTKFDSNSQAKRSSIKRSKYQNELEIDCTAAQQLNQQQTVGSPHSILKPSSNSSPTALNKSKDLEQQIELQEKEPSHASHQSGEQVESNLSNLSSNMLKDEKPKDQSNHVSPVSRTFSEQTANEAKNAQDGKLNYLGVSSLQSAASISGSTMSINYDYDSECYMDEKSSRRAFDEDEFEFDDENESSNIHDENASKRSVRSNLRQPKKSNIFTRWSWCKKWLWLNEKCASNQEEEFAGYEEDDEEEDEEFDEVGRSSLRSAGDHPKKGVGKRILRKNKNKSYNASTISANNTSSSGTHGSGAAQLGIERRLGEKKSNSLFSRFSRDNSNKSTSSGSAKRYDSTSKQRVSGKSTCSVAAISQSGRPRKHRQKSGGQLRAHSSSTTAHSESGNAGQYRFHASEADRHKRRIAKAREKRATLILGLIMAAFILGYIPFSTMYLVQGICPDCQIQSALTITYWIGYTASAINPIIYTVFNRDFRRSFRKILFR